MQPQQLAHFATLIRIAGAARKLVEAGHRFGMWYRERPAGSLRPQSIEKIDQRFKIVVHCCLNARVFDSCKLP